MKNSKPIPRHKKSHTDRSLKRTHKNSKHILLKKTLIEIAGK